MLSNSNGKLAKFLDQLIEIGIDEKRQLRLPKKQLLSAVSEFLKVSGRNEDPVLVFEAWEPILRQSLFVGDYAIRYNPFTETLAIHWVPTWKNIEWAAETRSQNLRNELRDFITSLSSEEFERLMQQVFSRVPWAKDVRVTGRTGDGGIDFAGTFVERQSGLEFLLLGQAKHWGPKVGSDPVRTFIGSVALRAKAKPTVGVLVSTGGFTTEAEEAIHSSPTKILQFDLDRLIDIIIQNKVGVSDVTIRGQQLDGRFWDELRT